MFPIALDLKRISVLLVGQGPMLAKRITQLQEAGATRVTVLDGRLPTLEEVVASGTVMACGLSDEDAKTLAAMAGKAGKLINVEDVVELCDYYFTATVRRGDLLISVSTCGASPTLAKRVRDIIGKTFGPEWAERLQRLAAARQTWRAEGKTMKQVVAQTDELISREGWLPEAPGKEAA